jgi:hypothetical protein
MMDRRQSGGDANTRLMSPDIRRVRARLHSPRRDQRESREPVARRSSSSHEAHRTAPCSLHAQQPPAPSGTLDRALEQAVQEMWTVGNEAERRWRHSGSPTAPEPNPTALERHEPNMTTIDEEHSDGSSEWADEAIRSITSLAADNPRDHLQWHNRGGPTIFGRPVVIDHTRQRQQVLHGVPGLTPNSSSSNYFVESLVQPRTVDRSKGKGKGKGKGKSKTLPAAKAVAKAAAQPGTTTTRSRGSRQRTNHYLHNAGTGDTR